MFGGRRKVNEPQVNYLTCGSYLRKLILGRCGIGRAEELCERMAKKLAVESRIFQSCANRRSFLEMLEKERQRGKRHASTFSILSLDIDHFKRINDLHGHPGGDQLLRHFASSVEKNLRSTDLLGRMGGEEFGILLPFHRPGFYVKRIFTQLCSSFLI